jgi:hypothetical protein
MHLEVWTVAGSVCLLALAGSAYAWLRMPRYRWSCRHCKKIVTVSRLHPGQCTCGASTLVAYFCGDCGSWNTSPTAKRRCVGCSSKNIILGAEYNFGRRLVRIRNRNTQRTTF